MFIKRKIFILPIEKQGSKKLHIGYFITTLHIDKQFVSLNKNFE
jgi:hypothetical protein